jgi:hypothetical protein
MMNPGSFNIDSTRIEEIVITKAAIENTTEITSLEKEGYLCNFTFGFVPGINVGLKKIRIIFSCQIIVLDSHEKPIGIDGNFDVRFVFHIDNLEQLVSGSPEDLQIDRELIASIANIVYSTSRGILYTRCQGTILKNLILPVASTDKLLEMLTPAK